MTILHIVGTWQCQLWVESGLSRICFGESVATAVYVRSWSCDESMMNMLSEKLLEKLPALNKSRNHQNECKSFILMTCDEVTWLKYCKHCVVGMMKHRVLSWVGYLLKQHVPMSSSNYLVLNGVEWSKNMYKFNVNYEGLHHHPWLEVGDHIDLWLYPCWSPELQRWEWHRRARRRERIIGKRRAVLSPFCWENGWKGSQFLGDFLVEVVGFHDDSKEYFKASWPLSACPCIMPWLTLRQTSLPRTRGQLPSNLCTTNSCVAELILA